jgi:hypothetical protein
VGYVSGGGAGGGALVVGGGGAAVVAGGTVVGFGCAGDVGCDDVCVPDVVALCVLDE